jgi:hypothetical protein
MTQTRIPVFTGMTQAQIPVFTGIDTDEDHPIGTFGYRLLGKKNITTFSNDRHKTDTVRSLWLFYKNRRSLPDLNEMRK